MAVKPHICGAFALSMNLGAPNVSYDVTRIQSSLRGVVPLRSGTLESPPTGLGIGYWLQATLL